MFFPPDSLALCCYYSYVTWLLSSYLWSPAPHCCLIGGFQVRAHYHIHEKCFAAMWFGSQSLPYYQIKPIWFERFIHCWINISDIFIFLMGITGRGKLSYCPLEAGQFRRRHLFSFQLSSRMHFESVPPLGKCKAIRSCCRANSK